MRYFITLLLALAVSPAFAQSNVIEQKTYRNVPHYRTSSAMTVEFPNGYRTRVYALDGMMPQVSYCTSNGYVQIVCNYEVKYPLSQMKVSNGVVRYDLITSGARRNPEPPVQPQTQSQPKTIPQRSVPNVPEAPSRLEDAEIDQRFIPKARGFAPSY